MNDEITRVMRSDVVGTPSVSPDKDEKVVVEEKVTLIKTDSNNPPIVKMKRDTAIGFVHNHVQVQTVVTPIIGENPNRKSLIIRNITPEVIWVGESGVSAGLNGNGFPLKEDNTIILDNSFGAVYAIVENNTGVVAIIEE